MRKFSTSFDLNELMDWHPNALYVLSRLSKHCLSQKIPLHLNSGIRAIYDGISKSRTHQDGRAFDIRVKYWSKQDMGSVVKFLQFLDRTEAIGALSAADNIRRLAYYHDNHLHIQVSP